MALWHSSHHNLLLFICWAGEPAPAFPLAAFDYWSLTPHFSTAASKTNTELGADGATQLWSFYSAQTAPFLHFLTHKWHQPMAGDLPAGAAAAPVSVGWPKNPQSCWDPSLLMGSSAPPSLWLPTANPPCAPERGSAVPQGEEGPAWAPLAHRRVFVVSPAPSPGASPAECPW